MPELTFRFKLRSSATINQETITKQALTTEDKSSIFHIKKPLCFKGFVYENPFHPVIYHLKIYFKHHQSISPSTLEHYEQVLSHDCVFYNPLASIKRALNWEYYSGKEWLHLRN